jgi:hypothetical protein
MRSCLPTLTFFLATLCFSSDAAPQTIAVAEQTAIPDYVHDVSAWQTVQIPPRAEQAAYWTWFYAANYSRHAWRVSGDHGQITAEPKQTRLSNGRERPQFVPKAGRFEGGSAFARVDDGWLVGFNQGEFGAALYWFSLDGEQNYKISDHQIVDFFYLPDGVHAIEGLAHLSMSKGSIIRIARSQPQGRWQASTAANLPFAPYAISVLRDHSMLVVLSNSLVSVSPDYKISTLLPDAPWSSLYPNSSVLSADEKKIYIGMRQYVGEFNVATNVLRFLVPSDAFLNRLPQEMEQRIRQQ